MGRWQQQIPWMCRHPNLTKSNLQKSLRLQPHQPCRRPPHQPLKIRFLNFRPPSKQSNNRFAQSPFKCPHFCGINGCLAGNKHLALLEAAVVVARHMPPILCAKWTHLRSTKFSIFIFAGPLLPIPRF